MEAHRQCMSKLRESGAHTDFTITAGEKTFRVHSWVLWPGSEYWETVIFGEFAEAHSKRIDLSDDGPEMVTRMLDFCYTLDYSDKWVVDREPDYVSTAHTNAKMYVLADRCRMNDLRKAALAKLEEQIKKYIDYTGAACMGKFAALVAYVYENTRESDRPLRDLIVKYTLKAWKLLFQDEEFKMAFVDTPDFIHDIFSRHSIDEAKISTNWVEGTWRSPLEKW